MRVLVLGATGNLGSRAIAPLLAHGHTVTVFVRSDAKLRALITLALYSRLSVCTGDAFNTDEVYKALKDHNCDAIFTAAGNREPIGKPQILARLAVSISSAAIKLGKERRKPLRCWFTGGVGSLQYPGTQGYQLQDYMPAFAMAPHRETEEVVKSLDVREIEWTLLCVATMMARSKVIDVLDEPVPHGLTVDTVKAPAWTDSWVRRIPVVGVYLNIWAVLTGYATKLEDVGELVAEEMSEGRYVGEFLGFRDEKSTDGLLDMLTEAWKARHQIV